MVNVGENKHLPQTPASTLQPSHGHPNMESCVFLVYNHFKKDVKDHLLSS